MIRHRTLHLWFATLTAIGVTTQFALVQLLAHA
jgi:hypothetical protein